MKLIAQVRLDPTPEQAAYLLQTLEAANALCNTISEFAWGQKVFGAFNLHKALYHQLRAETGITAQVVVRMFAKVADAYKLDKQRKRSFKPHGAIAYDDRILHWYTKLERVSIWSVGGRLNIPYSAGEKQSELLQYQQGESDLVYSKTAKEFFLLAVCDIPDPDQRQTDEALGIDMGVANIAVDSDGDIFSSERIEYTRMAQDQKLDASQPLPFDDQSFDAVVCIDAINHLPGRLRVLKQWYRVLKSGGRILFTDPITITGLLTNEEIAIRSSIGFFLFAPPDEDGRLIEEAGFQLVLREDVTENIARISGRWYEARAKRQDDLITIESEATYQGTQNFLSVAHKISSERRLSRFLFVARKP